MSATTRRLPSDASRGRTVAPAQPLGRHHGDDFDSTLALRLAIIAEHIGLDELRANLIANLVWGEVSYG